MKVFYHSDCLLHDPPHEILDGRQMPYLENPSRITIVQKVLADLPEHFQLSDKLDDTLDLKEWILKVHEPEYLDYLEHTYEEYVSDGGDDLALFPDTFLHASLASKTKVTQTKLSAKARTGLYCFDLSSPLTKDTPKAILASLRVTLSAAKAIPYLAPGQGVFALCRPPGHHAMPSLSGGYCYINNVAVAARFLQSMSPGLDRTKVAILDIDYHHGNGTWTEAQAIFYSDPKVLYVSLHAENDYPYFTGFITETGSNAGEGFNVNVPLPVGTTGDEEYCEALTGAVELIKDFNPEYLLVSLGVDTHAGDPICDFKLSTDGYLHVGRIISSMKKPTLFVFEGGYHHESLGFSVRNVLNGFQLRG